MGSVHAGARLGNEIQPGFCVRITTGAPVPDEADAVVQVEDTELLQHDSTVSSSFRFLVELVLSFISSLTIFVFVDRYFLFSYSRILLSFTFYFRTLVFFVLSSS